MVDPTSKQAQKLESRDLAPYMLTAVISLVCWGDPDCMKAARNSPSVFPPFVIIWSDTEIEPAL
jgi:hypothetical protein